jgi:hypothetical protein
MVMGTERDEIRASDADRERTVEQLRQYTAEGRLTMDEFEERMSAAYAATTYGDLAKLTRDLPVDLGARGRPAAAPFTQSGPVDIGSVAAATLFGFREQRHAARAAYRAERRNANANHPMHPGRGSLAGPAATWASMSVLLTGIWFLAGLADSNGWGEFWPVWPIGIFGLILLTRVIGGLGGRR